VATSANLIQLFEARWTAAQLESHLEAGRRVDSVRAAAFHRIGDALRAGETITEWDINRFIRYGFEKSGLFTDHGPIVAVNEHMSDQHYEPKEEGSAPIRPGDPVLLDMWAKLDQPDAVYYDITWTGFCGSEIPDKYTKIFEIVSAGRDRAIECVQSAASGNEILYGYQVDDAARTSIAAAGYGEYFVHRTGHSIGEEVHGNGANMDNLESHDERRVIPRTCFSIEPGVYLPEFGIRSEVNMYVAAGSARVTGEIQKNMVRIL
jgi:Xaa-Pro aminopeptidase